MQNTPRLLAIIAEVLAPAGGRAETGGRVGAGGVSGGEESKDQQVTEETRGKIVELVRFVGGKWPAEVGKWEGLRGL